MLAGESELEMTWSRSVTREQKGILQKVIENHL
jgi:hypothetical protein